jgi:aminoglycoside phosphotransferase (APT) family kinase protein
MGEVIVNKELEAAARRELTRLVKAERILKPLYLQPDRAVFFAEETDIILKVYLEGKTLEQEYAAARKAAEVGVPVPEFLGFEAGTPTVLAMRHVQGVPLSSNHPRAAREAGSYLRSFHEIGATPPFSGGQTQWDTFISWWWKLEWRRVKNLGVLGSDQMNKLQTWFEAQQPLLESRPVALLHGDLQDEHILVDPQTDRVQAFLDFADAQPGDPLEDIAVLTLWDTELADLLLEGYGTIEKTEETQHLLMLYRRLRHLGGIPWLLKRGFDSHAEKSIVALREALR